MVTAAITGATAVSLRVAQVIAALEAVDRARKEVQKLRKMGLVSQANAMERDCNRAEARIKSSLSKEQRRKASQRRKARTQTRGSSGRFR